MSFKDVRDLSEHLKILGYSVNFPLSLLYSTYGGPNSFKVIADILQWLVGRLEPGTILPGGTTDSTERILLIRSAAEFFVTKAGIKLNPRKLYASTSAAATELLKITSVLMNAPVEVDDKDEEQFKNFNHIDLGDKVDELRRARELSSELTNIGATLYDLMGKEIVNKEARTVQATRPLELVNVERSLKTAINIMNQKLQSSKIQLESSRNEKKLLVSKLERKTADLERVKQRLEALQKIRPAFLEEFERLEMELKLLYDQYFIRIRCLDALKSQVAARVKTPSAIIQNVNFNNQSNKQNDNSMNLLGADNGMLDSDEEDDELDNLVNDYKMKTDELNDEISDIPVNTDRLRVRTGVTRDDKHRFMGSMTGGSSDMDDTSLGSDGSASDNDFMEDLRSENDGRIINLTNDSTVNNPIKTNRSDEDF